MAMMNFMEFTEWAKTHLMEYLPPEYQKGEVVVHPLSRLGNSYMAITVIQDRNRSVPAVNLEECYKDFVRGRDPEAVMRKIAATITDNDVEYSLDYLRDYNLVKNTLFLRASNAHANEAVLKNVPHQLRQDIALTCHILISDEDNSLSSCMITNGMLEDYGITKEQLFQDTIRSSEILFPATIQSLYSTLSERVDYEGVDMGIPQNPSVNAMVITNRQFINGAAALFYPDVMDQLTEKMNGDYYIIPSSIHECIAIPADCGRDCHELNQIVHAVNAYEVMDSDQLSDHVYHYDPVHKLFELGTDYQERKYRQEHPAQKDSVLKKLNEKKQISADSRMNMMADIQRNQVR